MHVATLLHTRMFGIRIAGAPAQMEDLFPGWTELDRFGVVIDEAFGGIGATHLIQCAMMAFYDAKPTRRSSRAVYPEIYAFHIGKCHGAHAAYDFWPARREVILRTNDHRVILDAINDRGITRLAVPDRPPREVIHRPKEVEAAVDRISSAFLYSATGRISAANVEISGLDPRTEFNPTQTLRAASEIVGQRRAPGAINSSGIPIKEADDDYSRWLEACETEITSLDRERARATRTALRTATGTAVETYSTVDTPEALKRLASASTVQPDASRLG